VQIYRGDLFRPLDLIGAQIPVDQGAGQPDRMSAIAIACEAGGKLDRLHQALQRSHAAASQRQPVGFTYVELFLHVSNNVCADGLLPSAEFAF
jgi:hypothetical protein